MTPGDDALADALRQLRIEYLRDAPPRVAELWALLERVNRGENAALDELARALHKLAGSGGSYGFPGISAASRTGEHEARRLLASAVAPLPEQVRRLHEMIREVENAFATAVAEGPATSS